MVIDLDIYKEIRDGKRLDWKWQEYFYNSWCINHTEKEREINDYYATDPIAVDALLQGGQN